MVLELDIDIVADNKHIDSEHDIDNSKQHDDKSSDACARDNVESSVHNGHNNISLDIEWRHHLEQK
jgi:hypothetical protein